MNHRPRLLFVYNADSGLFNTLADIGHKMLSPDTYECRLCALTHGYFTERKAWRSFLESLDADCDFLHRDEFRKRHPEVAAPLPAVFRLDGDRPAVCLEAGAVKNCKDLNELQLKIASRCLRA